MNKKKQEIKDIEVDGNTVRFVKPCAILVHKPKAHEPSIVIESGRAKM